MNAITFFMVVFVCTIAYLALSDSINSKNIGSIGSLGHTGPMGPVGPKGLLGPQGSPGLAGVVGDKGNRGGRGQVGLSIWGQQGSSGSQGQTSVAIGPTGAQGLPYETNILNQQLLIVPQKSDLISIQKIYFSYTKENVGIWLAIGSTRRNNQTYLSIYYAYNTENLNWNLMKHPASLGSQTGFITSCGYNGKILLVVCKFAGPFNMFISVDFINWYLFHLDLPLGITDFVVNSISYYDQWYITGNNNSNEKYILSGPDIHALSSQRFLIADDYTITSSTINNGIQIYCAFKYFNEFDYKSPQRLPVLINNESHFDIGFWQRCTQAVFNGSYWIVTGCDAEGNCILYSKDALTWTIATIDQNDLITNDFKLLYDIFGIITFQSGTNNVYPGSCIYYSGSKYMFICISSTSTTFSAARTLKRTGGQQTLSMSSNSVREIADVAWNGTFWHASGVTFDGTPVILMSTDGLEWASNPVQISPEPLTIYATADTLTISPSFNFFVVNTNDRFQVGSLVDLYIQSTSQFPNYQFQVLSSHDGELVCFFVKQYNTTTYQPPYSLMFKGLCEQVSCVASNNAWAKRTYSHNSLNQNVLQTLANKLYLQRPEIFRQNTVAFFSNISVDYSSTKVLISLEAINAIGFYISLLQITNPDTIVYDTKTIWIFDVQPDTTYTFFVYGTDGLIKYTYNNNCGFTIKTVLTDTTNVFDTNEIDFQPTLNFLDEKSFLIKTITIPTDFSTFINNPNTSSAIELTLQVIPDDNTIDQNIFFPICPHTPIFDTTLVHLDDAYNFWYHDFPLSLNVPTSVPWTTPNAWNFQANDKIDIIISINNSTLTIINNGSIRLQFTYNRCIHLIIV